MNMEKKFITAITCMDGRIQTVVVEYLQAKYQKEYVDTIPAAGPVLLLSEGEKKGVIEDLKFRTDISVHKHDSNVIAVVGHFDCAGVPLPDSDQMKYIEQAKNKVIEWYDEVEVIGLWVSSSLEITEI
jgi:carbonic anhydrase